MSTLLLSLGLLGSPALAQAPASGVTGDVTRTIEMAPEERIAFAEEGIAEIEGAVAQLERMVDKAGRSNDAEARDAIVPRLAAIKALQNVAKAALGNLLAAMEAEETARIELEFRKIVVALTKTRQLLAEAQRRGADQGLESGSTSLEWQEQLVESDGFEEAQMDEMAVPPDAPQVSAFQ